MITGTHELAGCFVLLSNVPADWNDDYNVKKILRTHKEQYGIENNFSFLKVIKLSMLSLSNYLNVSKH